MISSRERNREELLFSAKDAAWCLPQSFALFEGVEVQRVAGLSFGLSCTASSGRGIHHTEW